MGLARCSLMSNFSHSPVLDPSSSNRRGSSIPYVQGQLMHGSVSSVRAFSSFAQQSPSRIPHLELHILARRPRSKAASSIHRTNPVQRRYNHVATPPFSLLGLFPSAVETAQDIQRPKSSTISTLSDTQDFGVHDNLDQILNQAQPERVLYALLCTSEGKRFVAQADSVRFDETFCTIDPRYFITPFKDIYHYIQPSLETLPKYRWVRAVEDRLDAFAQQLRELIEGRRSAGHQLSKLVCNHLLHCARVLGDGLMAREVWQVLIPEDQLNDDLDLWSYNCYQEAICWTNAFRKSERWRLRVSSRILQIRSRDDPPSDFSGHRVGNMGLRHETLENFRQMVSAKIEGNEETFTNLMIAMGREGDLAGVKSILKSVYNIDVDLLLEFDEEEVESPTFYEVGSPLRPTHRLLYTLAHVFGSNNDIGLATKLVDLVSRMYNIRIPFNVWVHLFDWVVLLSLRRSSAKKRQSQTIGQIPHSFVERLWTEMTAVPHNIQPDLVMHIRRAQAFRNNGLLRESLQSIRTAKMMYDKSNGEAKRLGEDLLAFTDHILKHRSTTSPQVIPAEWFDMRRNFILLSITEDRDLQLLSVAVRRTLKSRNWPERGRYKGWERRGLPDLIAEFKENLPNSLTYATRGGRIEIALRSDRLRATKSGMQMTRWNGLLRGHLDRDLATVEDLMEARQRFRAKLEEIEGLDKLYHRRRCE